jgi:hypothetical protein
MKNKPDIPKDPKREDLEEESADEASAPHPTGGALVGRSLDKKGRYDFTGGNSRQKIGKTLTLWPRPCGDARTGGAAS